jgi:5'-nucleotidase
MIFEFRNNAWKLQPTSQVTASTDDAAATFANTRRPAPDDVGGV